MAEYLERESILNAIRKASSLYVDQQGLYLSCELIAAMPATDVQPVKWISVDEALPIYDGLVLAIDKNNTVRLCIYTEFGWLSQYGNPMIAHITHWQPLPEPPKDGDTNG